MKFTEEHEWLSLEGDVVTVGITEHATEQLGDIVFIELPAVGRKVGEGEEIVIIESVKAASDICSPLDGEIIAINDEIVEQPAEVNKDAMKAWFFKIRIDDPSALEKFMDQAAYQAMVG